MVKQYLLDTHSFLWAVTAGREERLSEPALSAILDEEAELYLSAASLYEIAYKYKRGKLNEYEKAVLQYEDNMLQLGAKELPITSAHAYAAGVMDWEHGDPFDRILAAQSAVEGYALITKDAVFDQAPGVNALWS
ncbi:twitching motility protein PilT [Clostridia bacterium]|nr:twitching motility protein PilT [Clostridia bacterium]